MTPHSFTKRLFAGFLVIILLLGAASVFVFLSVQTNYDQKSIGNKDLGDLQGTCSEPTSVLTAATALKGAKIIPVSGCSPTQNFDFEIEVLGLVNQERSKKGVPELDLQNQLAAAALAHSADMACRGFFSHIDPDGKTVYDRIRAQDYQYECAGENIYAGDDAFNTPRQAINTWLSSRTHRATLLNPAYTEVGVAIIYLPGSNFGAYYTLVFADP